MECIPYMEKLTISYTVYKPRFASLLEPSGILRPVAMVFPRLQGMECKEQDVNKIKKMLACWEIESLSPLTWAPAIKRDEAAPRNLTWRDAMEAGYDIRPDQKLLKYVCVNEMWSHFTIYLFTATYESISYYNLISES